MDLKRSAILSLAAYAGDSDADSDADADDVGVKGLVPGYDDDAAADGGQGVGEVTHVGNDGDMEVQIKGDKKSAEELVASFSNRVRQMSTDEIQLPPEPAGRCSNQLQDKILKLYERKINEGIDLNVVIQQKKEFRNPSIYEKLIQFCGIDELGTNYPKDIFDPHGWSEDSYYESLAKTQKLEMEKLERAKKERTKIEFVTGLRKPVALSTTTTATSASSSATTGGGGGTTTTTTTAGGMVSAVSGVGEPIRRRSKWDSAVPTGPALPATANLSINPSGSLSINPPAGQPTGPAANQPVSNSSASQPMGGASGNPSGEPAVNAGEPSVNPRKLSVSAAGRGEGGRGGVSSTTFISALGNIRKHRLT